MANVPPGVTRITTNAYVLVEGQRKTITHTDPAGVTRQILIDIDFVICPRCGATLLPDGGNGRLHRDWHARAEAAP